jgi:hypothetical protein
MPLRVGVGGRLNKRGHKSWQHKGDLDFALDWIWDTSIEGIWRLGIQLDSDLNGFTAQSINDAWRHDDNTREE